ARIVRQKDRHDFYEYTVAVQLEGDFESSYTEGDNSRVLPTDTMKNTVHAFAARAEIAEPESFALLLGRHFVENNPQVRGANIEIATHGWSRHSRFAFTAGPSDRRMAWVSATRDAAVVESGVAGFVILRTSGSAFEGYAKDRYTTLKETRDRILATSI